MCMTFLFTISVWNSWLLYRLCRITPRIYLANKYYRLLHVVLLEYSTWWPTASLTLVQAPVPCSLYRQSHCSFHAGAGPAETINRCGSSFSDAKSKCVKCPKGIDSECGKGETCYAGLPNCRVPPAPAGPRRPGTWFVVWNHVVAFR